MFKLWTKKDYQISPPFIVSRLHLKKVMVDPERSVPYWINDWSARSSAFSTRDSTSSRFNTRSQLSNMIMMPCLLMIMMIMKNLLELPFSQRWEKQQGWPCKKRWWSTWRTTRSLQQFALRRPEQPRKWIVYNFTSQLRLFEGYLIKMNEDDMTSGSLSDETRNFIRDGYRELFRPNFSKSRLRLFLDTKFFETETDTFFKTRFFETDTETFLDMTSDSGFGWEFSPIWISLSCKMDFLKFYELFALCQKK